MPKLLVCELRTPCPKLLMAIKKYHFAMPTSSSYVLDTDDSCEQIRDNLWQYIGANDRIFVAELTGVTAWYNC